MKNNTLVQEFPGIAWGAKSRLAELAGISRPTLYRYLDGESVREETVTAIEAAIEQLKMEMA